MLVMTAAEDIAAVRENARSLLCDKDGEQWIEVEEITDVASAELRAARDVFRLAALLAATEAERDQALADVETVGEDLDAQVQYREAAEKERDQWKQSFKTAAERGDAAHNRREEVEAREAALLAEREAERKAWAGIEQKASGLLHRLDALKDAARRTDHGAHHYDIDVQRMDCWLCAAIEDRYQPEWMDEPYECLNDPIVRRLRMQTKPLAASSPEGENRG